MNLQPKHVYTSVILIAGVLMLVMTGSFAYYTNQSFGFPLDDPWIHLQFAKNLHDYGSFSYYKGEMATSGSTSPLYTLLLAAGFFVTSQEMILSYAMGAFFFLLGAVYMFRLAESMFRGALLYAVAAALLFVLEPHLQWIALSGMETTLFIALLLATVYYYHEKKPIALGISAGLLIWTRPEAVILFGVLGADALYRRFVAERSQQPEEESTGSAGMQWIVRPLVIMFLFGILYIVFNLSLSGSILPNTYAAKLKYYAHGGENFPMQVVQFLGGGALLAFAPSLLIGLFVVLQTLIRRRSTALLVPLMFSLGMIGAYWWKLPYLYQNGRYLMPVLPFVILIGLEGMRAALAFFRPRTNMLAEKRTFTIVQVALVTLFAASLAYGSWESRASYQDYCNYINNRQVKTAHWIHDHLPENAVVATHDVGAIAFYSGRRIVDMVGLISPEAIANIGNMGKMEDFLIHEGVTHLAVLRNWFEVVNINPLFRTNEQTPEIMEVFKFDTSRVHFTSREVNWLTNTGWSYLSAGDVRDGGPMVERAVQLDSLSSRAHDHFAWALMMIGQFDRAEQELHKAIEIQPDNWNAYFALTQVPLRRGDTEEGIKRLEALLRLNPKMLAAYQVLARVYEQQGDTAKAQASLEAFARKNAEMNKTP